MLVTSICVITGLAAGMLSGLIGLGGATIILPVLIYVLGMNQHLAQGTALAILLPPVGILAVWTYYKHGHVDFKIAMIICAGFVIGALFGSKLAVLVSGKYLKMLCGVIFILIGIKMTFFKD